MTYCVGLLLEDGLAMLSDTRTNAGVDNFSSYRKLHVIETPGERVLAVSAAGSLSVTQSALQLATAGHLDPETGETLSLATAPTLFSAAQLLGTCVSTVRHRLAPSAEAKSVNLDVTLLLGGQIKGGKMGLYLIYSAGNFIECGPETPFLQIGESKYGKPILSRSVKYATPLAEGVKLGLLSFDSTIRSNLAVGLPVDVLTLRPGDLASSQHRVEQDDPYFRDLSRKWDAALDKAQRAMPTPPWMTAKAEA